MRRKRIVVLLAMFLLFGVAVYLFFIGAQKNKMASLLVSTNVNLPISVNGQKVASANYTGVMLPGKTKVTIGDYEALVNLTAGVKTVIDRNFDPNGGTSGEIITLESNGLDNAMMIFSSNPNGAGVNVDGRDYGVAPVAIDDLIAGVHKVTINLEGYVKQDFEVNSYEGYKLMAYIDLSPAANETKITATPIPQTKQMVKILTTPNGFLRVRTNPDVNSAEVAEVHDGNTYELVESKTGWFKISQGWISSAYAIIVTGK